MQSSSQLILGAVALAFVAAPHLAAQPTITAVENAASNIAFVTGVANAGIGAIAQGSIFVVKGSGLGPANISIASAPFQSTTLSGTSVSIKVSGQQPVNALLYYTSDTQVAALVPSSTVAGLASVTVTYNGQSSAASVTSVVTSSVGIFTIGSTGEGPAIVTYADYSLVSSLKAANCGGPNTACGAANPGDTLILWATGLGPVNGDDASGAGLGQNMPNVPLTLWLGGVEVPVIYQGRSGCCIGEDQIVFTVPNNVPTGCSVPLVVQIGTGTSTISNTGELPVANGGRNCTSNNAAVAATVANALPLLTAGQPFSFADIDVEHAGPAEGGDAIQFPFVKAAPAPGVQPEFLLSYNDTLPLGTCIANAFKSPSSLTAVGSLDAGSNFTIKGPNGSLTEPLNSGNFDTLSANGTYLTPGSYTVTGTGGADIGAFSVNFTVLAFPALTSPANGATVTRSSGMTVSWTGGDPGGNLRIIVASQSNGPSAQCIVPSSPGTFIIPAYVMLALPTGGYTFSFASAWEYVPVIATGLNVGIFQYANDGVGVGVVLQ